jgi:hypothetical protein
MVDAKSYQTGTTSRSMAYAPSVAERPINLNRARKRKARADRERNAEANRAKHGRTNAEREHDRKERERADRAHEGTKLDDE